MLKDFWRQAWSRIVHFFPERQIYIRSDGRVQFFTFDSAMQAICAGTGLLVLGWLAFTSVNVIFKDRIIAMEEQHFVEMQMAYEQRLAELQISYDELNGALTAAEDRFQATADSFEAKQQTLTNLIRHKQEIQSSLTEAKPAPAVKVAQAAPNQRFAYMGMNLGLGASIEDFFPTIAKSLRPSLDALAPLTDLSAFGASQPGQPAESQSAAPQPASFLGGAVRRIGEFFGRALPRADIDNVSLRHIVETERRLASLDQTSPSLADEAKTDIDNEVTRLTRIARRAGIDSKMLAPKPSTGGQGGPLLAAGQILVSESDEDFNSGIQGAIGSLNTLSGIVETLRTVPLAEPLEESRLTSGFGGRPDPLTENFDFHSGIDLSGVKGTDVHVTAPGVVVFAERSGAYGNMVEVDHGNNLRTRYAHLQKIRVPVGKTLEKGDVVGELGSTGRTTGPHVHYEVWYGNVVKDPQRFIKAGRDVFKGQ